MRKENKYLLLSIGLMFLTVVLMHKLPHNSYSVIEYIIRPIRWSNGFLNVSAFVIVALSFTSILLLKSTRFSRHHVIILGFCVIAIVVPLMKSFLNFSQEAYHWVKNDTLNALDIEEARINTSSTDNKMNVKVSFNVRNYGRNTNEFKFRVYLPKSLAKVTGTKVYESKNSYFIAPNQKNMPVTETFEVKLDEKKLRLWIDDYKWNYEDSKYELFNEDNVVKIINHGV